MEWRIAKIDKSINRNLLPSSANILVATGQLLYVILHNPNEGLVVKVALADPGRKLRVPDKGVAVNLLLVGLGPVTVAVGIVEGEVVAARLNDLPLHGVLGGERVEIGRVASNGLFGFVATAGRFQVSDHVKTPLIETSALLTE